MNDQHPTHDIFNMRIDHGESYYITPEGRVVHVLNVDEYFVHVMECQLFKVED